MAGTILKELSATPQADNTAITSGPGNSGFSSGSAGSGNTAVHLAAAKMFATAGYRFTQAGANQNNWYMDLTSAVAIFAFRIPFNFPTSSSTASTFLRAYPDTSHAATMWSLALNTSNRLNFVEAGTGGLNVTSSAATLLVPNTDYVMQGLVNTTTMALSIAVYPSGSATATLTLSGTLVTSTAQQSVRFGIGTASSLAQINTNDDWAIGSGDFLARSDIVTPPLDATVSISPSSGPNPTTTTLTITPSGGNGNTINYTVDWGDGSAVDGPQTSPIFTHSYTSAVGTETGTWTATQAA